MLIVFTTSGVALRAEFRKVFQVWVLASAFSMLELICMAGVSPNCPFLLCLQHG